MKEAAGFLTPQATIVALPVHHWLSEHLSTRFGALPGLRSYTGSDYTSSFIGKGELKTLELMQSNVELQHAIASMCTFFSMDEAHKVTLNRCVYNHIRPFSVNSFRCNYIEKSYSPGHWCTFGKIERGA